VLTLRALKGAAVHSRPVRFNPGQVHKTSAFGARRLRHLRRIGLKALNICHSTSLSFKREHYRSLGHRTSARAGPMMPDGGRYRRQMLSKIDQLPQRTFATVTRGLPASMTIENKKAAKGGGLCAGTRLAQAPQAGQFCSPWLRLARRNRGFASFQPGTGHRHGRNEKSPAQGRAFSFEQSVN
jgi:hypothetical protein